MTEGHKVCFCIVSLHPYVKEVAIDKESAFYGEIKKCMELGLRVYAYTTRLGKYGIKVEHEIPVSVT